MVGDRVLFPSAYLCLYLKWVSCSQHTIEPPFLKIPSEDPWLFFGGFNPLYLLYGNDLRSTILPFVFFPAFRVG